jgi:transcriptional regulator with XRE-family HTH domain
MPIKTILPYRNRRALNELLSKRSVPRLKHGDWLKTLRAALRMTQGQLARRAGLSQQHVALIEAGKIDPKVETLRALFDALFCDLVVLPVPRRRPGDIVAERTAERRWLLPSSRIWDTM